MKFSGLIFLMGLHVPAFLTASSNGAFERIMETSIGSFSLGELLWSLLLLCVCLTVKSIITKLFDRTLSAAALDKSLASFCKSMVKIVLYFIIVLIIASSLGIPMSSLIAVFSVAGIAVSLAVQGTLSNFAGGIMIMVSKPFGPGNYVEAAGVAGTIKEIGIVYTKLTTPDNKLILIPNSEISSGKIVNYSSESTRRIDNRFSASYDDSPEAVKKAILDALSSVEGILSEPAPFVNIAEYRDSSIAYAVQVWVENSNYAAVNSALLEEIKRQFDKHGIHMTYNHLNVHINKS